MRKETELPRQAWGDFAALSEYRSETQGQLFPVRLVTREVPPGGAHVALAARADDGNFYICKDDRSGTPCRMREAFFSQLAGEVNLVTPDFRIIEDQQTGETFFGSRSSPSTADEVARKRFLRTECKDELGRFPPFPGRWFSQLYVFDLFVHNWDRAADNLIVVRDGGGLRMRPIDFSACELATVDHLKFLDGKTETIQVARRLREVHGYFNDSAFQMIEQLKAVPTSVISGFFDGMPADWINTEERESLSEFWSGSAVTERLEALRAGLVDGRLL